MLDFDHDSTFFGIDVVLSDNQPNRRIPLKPNGDIALFDGRNLFKDAIAVFQKAFEFYNERRHSIADGG